MPIQSKRWQVSPSLPAAEASRFQHFHPVVARILYNRGYTTPDAASAFLDGQVSVDDPFKMRGMAQAVGRIRTAIKKQELIIVYGDFDADGVTSTVLLVSTLQALGANVKPYIPHRVDEGYGLNSAALEALAHKGARVIITVDCGIRSLPEVEIGKQCGLDMIITDHHSVGPDIPNALAVINPKQPGCLYPEKMLAGVGIAYKLAEALLKVSAAQDKREVSLQAEDLLDLVAIGTVADLAPLSRPENRSLVVRGLRHLQQARRVGVRALLKVAGLEPEKMNATAIGFTLGPRINAAGRLESAMLAYELLLTDDLQVASDLAQQLQTLNVKRQELTRAAQEHARTLAGIGEGDVPLIFAIDAAFQQGIVGLVAGRLTEEYYRPAIVLHRGEHESHGSCRSIAEFNITEALDQCADLLIRHGGHAQAAGFAIYNENLPVFHEKIMAIADKSLHDKDLRPSIQIDAEVQLGQVNETLYEALGALEPCGHDNAAPILCTKHLKIIKSKTLGKENAHLSLQVFDGSRTQDAIAFGMGDLIEDLPDYVDLAYRIDMNEWKDTRTLQMIVQDIRESE
ncbi:MAG: single-stranded-DNA-specific exonuclease RecJ [Chloroflexota bacterium]